MFGGNGKVDWIYTYSTVIGDNSSHGTWARLYVGGEPTDVIIDVARKGYSAETITRLLYRKWLGLDE